MKESWEIAELNALDLVKTGFPGAKLTKGTGSVNRDMDIIDEGLFVEVKSRNCKDIYITSADIRETISKISRRHGIWFFIYMNSDCSLYMIIEKSIYEKLILVAKPKPKIREILSIKCNESIIVHEKELELTTSEHGTFTVNTAHGTFYILNERDARMLLLLIKERINE